jgi:N-acetylglucosaminyldiphosphoundecaprenol N-acetyl-beta-D-mannosaminyltransferase
MFESDLPTRNIIEIPVNINTFEQQTEQITAWAKHRQNTMVCVANVHMLVEGWRDPDFANMLKNADILVPEGMPLVWMLNLMGLDYIKRVGGMELFLACCQKASAAQISIFLLGTEPEILATIHQRLAKDFPNLKIAGMYAPPFAPISKEVDLELVQTINDSGAGIVFVALGCPKQEKWMALYRDRLQAVLIGVGAVFPIYAGIMKQAPEFMRNAGLAWLFRLGQEPKRLWFRYLSTNPIFIYLALKQIIASKLTKH